MVLRHQIRSLTSWACVTTNGFKASEPSIPQAGHELQPMVLRHQIHSLTSWACVTTNGFKASRRVSRVSTGDIGHQNGNKKTSAKEPMVDEQTVCLIGRRKQEIVKNGQ